MPSMMTIRNASPGEVRWCKRGTMVPRCIISFHTCPPRIGKGTVLQGVDYVGSRIKEASTSVTFCDSLRDMILSNTYRWRRIWRTGERLLRRFVGQSTLWGLSPACVILQWSADQSTIDRESEVIIGMSEMSIQPWVHERDRNEKMQK